MSALDRLTALEQFGIKLGLDNIRALLAAMGHPETSWRAIHIAGTNGKGSVTAMVESALRHAGHTTGRYTSPHLDRLAERFEIDGAAVTDEQLEQAAADFFDLVDRLRADGTLSVWPTFFEATTAMAFDLFRRAQVDVGVIEVGLGGRFDATNALSPAVTAITSIDFDHERHLGRTLGAIAMEKAGIAKAGVPMIVGAVSAEAHAAITASCRERGARLIDAANGVDLDVSMEEAVATIRATTPVHAYPPVRLALRGRHQVGNALVALRVLECGDEMGITVGADAIVAGLEDARWPARLEWLRMGTKRLLVDAAHNPAGARALADYLLESGHAPLPIVLGVMQDKDVEGMLRAMAPAASAFITTDAPSARALPADALAAIVTRLFPAMPVRVVRDPEQAVKLALSEPIGGDHAADRRVEGVVAGSIYLIGPLRARLLDRGARPE